MCIPEKMTSTLSCPTHIKSYHGNYICGRLITTAPTFAICAILLPRPPPLINPSFPGPPLAYSNSHTLATLKHLSPVPL